MRARATSSTPSRRPCSAAPACSAPAAPFLGPSWASCWSTCWPTASIWSTSSPTCSRWSRAHCSFSLSGSISGASDASRRLRRDRENMVAQAVAQRTPILEARGISKRFGSVRALEGADFEVYPGEVVALIGDNGAGKSTLIKILSGALRPDSGTIKLRGQPVEFHSPRDARAAGIETVYQDLALAPDLDVAANLFLGRELKQPGLLGLLDFYNQRAMREQAAQH